MERVGSLQQATDNSVFFQFRLKFRDRLVRTCNYTKAGAVFRGHRYLRMGERR